MKKKPTSFWIYLLEAILMLLIIWGWNFLVAWGAVALAAKCFDFAFAWKYVWLICFILTFVAGIFRGSGNK